LACEAEAWRWAFEISPKFMLPHVQRSAGLALATYTRSTPGTLAAFRNIEAIRSGWTLHEAQLERLKEEIATQKGAR
jgi:hypothetical protein